VVFASPCAVLCCAVLCSDIVRFVGKSSARLVALQRYVVTSFSKDAVDALAPVFSPQEQSKFIIDFIEKARTRSCTCTGTLLHPF
jgi:hypothetical protein